MLGEALALLAALCWAVGAGFYRRSMRSVNPVGLNFVRSIPATAFLFLVTLLLGRMDFLSKLDPMITMYVVGASVVSWLIGDSLYFFGLKSIGVSRAVPIAYSYPLFLLPISMLLLREPFGYEILAGTLMIISAIWLISRSLGSGEPEKRGMIGLAASILAASCWAVGVASFKYLMSFIDPIFLAFFRMFTLLPLLGLYSMLSSSTKRSILGMRREELLLAAAGGVIAVGFGDMIYLVGLDLTRASIVGPLTATTPVFAGIIAAVKLRERPNLETILGIALITIGAALLSA
ncbi:MAG TPA: EamA family transporter [Nitrososphaeria archaeon]|nr:EamA family transporter [Nitrososphaeria archaeon]